MDKKITVNKEQLIAGVCILVKAMEPPFDLLLINALKEVAPALKEDIEIKTIVKDYQLLKYEGEGE